MTALNGIRIVSHPFLQENKPFENLKLLADLKSSKDSVMTESVHRNMPKRHFSPKTQRNITLLCTGLAALSGLALLFRAMMNSAERINANRAEELNIFGEDILAQNYLLITSVLALSVAGVYAATRFIVRDKSQGERFEELDREYCMAAEYLERNSEIKEELKRDICRKILENIPEIHASLQHFARLTPAQADYLTRKLSRAVSRSLQRSSP